MSKTTWCIVKSGETQASGVLSWNLIPGRRKENTGSLTVGVSCRTPSEIPHWLQLLLPGHRKWPGDEGGTQEKAADEEKEPEEGRQEPRESLEVAGEQRIEGGVYFTDFAVNGGIGLVVICYSYSFLIPLNVFSSL